MERRQTAAVEKGRSLRTRTTRSRCRWKFKRPPSGQPGPVGGAYITPSFLPCLFSRCLALVYTVHIQAPTWFDGGDHYFSCDADLFISSPVVSPLALPMDPDANVDHSPSKLKRPRVESSDVSENEGDAQREVRSQSTSNSSYLQSPLYPAKGRTTGTKMVGRT